MYEDLNTTNLRQVRDAKHMLVGEIQCVKSGFRDTWTVRWALDTAEARRLSAEAKLSAETVSTLD